MAAVEGCGPFPDHAAERRRREGVVGGYTWPVRLLSGA